MSDNALTLPESSMIMAQVDVANRYPRDEGNFVRNCFTAIEKACSSSADFAISCIYCKPVGSKGKGQKVDFVTGPSVRLTEVMQPAWRNLRTGYSSEITATRIRVQAVCWDVEKNIQEYAADECDCSNWSDYRKELKAKAMGAVAERDARLKVIGRAYADEIMGKIMDFLFAGDPATVWGECVKRYADLGVSEETLRKYFELAADEAPTKQIIFQALGVYNYLKENGESKLEYVFGSGFARTSSKPTNMEPVKRKSEEAASTQAPADPTAPKAPANKSLEPTPQEEFLISAQAILDELGYGEQGSAQQAYLSELLKPFKVQVLEDVPAQGWKTVLGELSIRYQAAKKARSGVKS